MKRLVCKNCGHKETLENINLNINNNVLIAQIPKIREKDGLHIIPLYCFKCNYITEWAADPNNNSVKAFSVAEYFKTFNTNKNSKNILNLLRMIL